MDFSEFTVRQALPADKYAVLQIHDNVYDGRDYLPYIYDFLLSSPNATSFVLLHQESVIGFKSIFLVDYGKTYVSRAGRINPRYGGQGLYRYLDDHVTTFAKSLGARVKALTAVDANENIFKTSFSNENRLLFRKPMLSFLFDAKTVNFTDIEKAKALTLEDVDNDRLAEYMDSKETSKYLFPYDRIIINWVPYKLLKSNIPYMRGPHETTNMFSDIKTDSNSYKGLFSSSTFYPTLNPQFLCNIETYGTDFQSLREHLMRHITILQKHTTGDTHLLLFGHQGLPVEDTVKFFSDHGVSRYKWCDSKNPKKIYSEQILFERDLVVT